MAVLAVTGVLAATMQTIVIPIIPRLPEYLNTTSADASWAIASTLLAAAIATPITGRLGDMYGKRRILLVLVALMAAGAIVCALSTELIPMIIGRALQGIGLGVASLGVSILRDVIHPKKLGSAIALVSATYGIGGGLGLPLSAIIAQTLDWHYLFWLAGLLAAGAFIAVAVVVPVSTLRTGGRFDFPGAVGLAVGLIGVLLAISKGNQWGWTSPLTLGLAIGGVVVLVAWGFGEVRTKSPLVDLRISSRRPVLLTNLASMAFGFSFFVVSASVPILLETPPASGVGFGLALIPASLCLMPLGLVMFVVSPIAARVTAARGPRTSILIGALIVASGFFLAVFFFDQIWHLVLLSLFTGVGIGFAYAAMPTLIMRSVPMSETAAANGLNAVVRLLGSTVSATLVGLIMSSQFVMHAGNAVPSRQAFVTIFIMGAAVAVAGAIVAFFIPRRTEAYANTASMPVQKP
jgi:MFS family permease